MQPPLLAPEIHAKALQEQRMQRLLLLEQYRAANVRHQHPFRAMIRGFRNVVGSSLVSVGNRMLADGDESNHAAGTA